MAKLKKHNGTKRPGVQPVNEKNESAKGAQPRGGHPLSQGGSRQGNIGHDYTNAGEGNRQPNE
jgi:hypothetical protein